MQKTHLTQEDRNYIEARLRLGNSLRYIAIHLGKSASTIKREINKNCIESKKVHPHRHHNACVKRKSCVRTNICNEHTGAKCRRKCSLCKDDCNLYCRDFIEERCPKLSRAPYVCNGCEKECECTLNKRFYIATEAQKKYRNVLIQTRKGFNLTEEEFIALSDFILPLLKKGHSLHSIVVNNPDRIMVNEKTLYRYIDLCLLKASRADLPFMGKMKKRKVNEEHSHKVDKKCRINRTYEDLLEYTKTHPHLYITEIDSVIGRVGGKVLLTIFFKSCGLQLAFLRDRNDSQSVIDVFNWLRSTLDCEIFNKMFQIVVTDNGSEFSNPNALECSLVEPQPSFRLFYCDPRASYQKGACERNHELLRKILPGGHSFDNLNQDAINLVMSHVNSYVRKDLGDKTPYDLFEELYGKGILEKLNIFKISPNDVILKPSLLGELDITKDKN